MPNRDPFERLEALQAKVQEVLALGGWKNGSKFGGRVAKILQRTSKEANSKRKTGVRIGCEHPEHWDWQQYLVIFKHLVLYTNLSFKESQTDDRYNREDPCMATDQIFLGFKRWFEIYTQDCRKPTPKLQFGFLNRKSPVLDKFRNKMFIDMQCDKHIKKYNLSEYFTWTQTLFLKTVLRL